MQLKLIKSVRENRALDVASCATATRKPIQTSPSPPRLCLPPPCMHTCEFLDPCAPAGHGQLPLLCRDPGWHVHLCIELGRCISPEIASTRTDLIPGEKHGVCHEINKVRSSKSDERIHAMYGKMTANVSVVSAMDIPQL